MLTLYGTVGCHLCDEAEQLLKAANAARPFAWQYVDIALDDALVARYGIRIPVLLRQEGDRQHELSWPFSLLDILALSAGD